MLAGSLVVKLELDRERDIALVILQERPIARSADLGSGRFVYYEEHDNIISYEFYQVSLGVDLSGLPDGQKLAELLGQHGIAILA